MAVDHPALDGEAFGDLVLAHAADPVGDEDGTALMRQLGDRVFQNHDALAHHDTIFSGKAMRRDRRGLFVENGEEPVFEGEAPRPVYAEIDGSADEKGAYRRFPGEAVRVSRQKDIKIVNDVSSLPRRKATPANGMLHVLIIRYDGMIEEILARKPTIAHLITRYSRRRSSVSLPAPLHGRQDRARYMTK